MFTLFLAFNKYAFIHLCSEGYGSTYGTFAGRIEYFSPKKAEKKASEPPKPNIKTNPSKKGTGYGYANVALNKYPEYKSDKYDAINELARV